ncbi:maleylpyruvate isomerase family mycothiol-dependent enzyme [Nocardioides sp. TRM66260-LWL]|uniref:maleylpyruvate isomerase family mycothiol-dependent enzyme n=1 Tax=Nocardioides sp. TRM66260-LWL TaxID=2874478 RepID=UPI001CC5F1A0|nr:maleylpyruvate isomerase family mycothiol-dependent enzyme [Nocardioides sp. TRM66260-LWL]MBZ5735764.1 maleylpyruvate isomerase family mycothiol-dependent enzyme [Nocardioides sp. TRM66260-LWL]
MSDEQLLAAHVETWWRSVADLLEVLDGLAPHEWDLPTDLPGWDVRAVAAHTAHLESVLATGVEEQADIGEAPHATGLLGQYTEIGVVNRRATPPAEIVEEIRRVTAQRHADLGAAMPTDASARPERVFGGVPWDWGTLLRNRPFDVWMHEQDVRRAVGRPGGLDSPGARHAVTMLAGSLGYVLGKRAGAPAGTTLVLEVVGPQDEEPAVDVFAVGIDESGRGRPLAEPPAEPTVRLRTDRATFVALAGGRLGAADADVTVEGDAALGARVLASLATTP